MPVELTTKSVFYLDHKPVEDMRECFWALIGDRIWWSYLSSWDVPSADLLEQDDSYCADAIKEAEGDTHHINKGARDSTVKKVAFCKEGVLLLMFDWKQRMTWTLWSGDTCMGIRGSDGQLAELREGLL